MNEKDKPISVAFANHVPEFSLYQVVDEQPAKSFLEDPKFVEGRYIIGANPATREYYGTLIMGIAAGSFKDPFIGTQSIKETINNLVDESNRYTDPNILMICKALNNIVLGNHENDDNNFGPIVYSNGSMNSRERVEAFAQVYPKYGAIVFGAHSNLLGDFFKNGLWQMAEDFDVYGHVGDIADYAVNNNLDPSEELSKFKFSDPRTAIAKKIRMWL